MLDRRVLGRLDRLRIAGIVWAPATFITGWLAAGLITEGYSPARDHISDLDAIDAPTRPLMNAAFVSFALGAGLSAGPLRRFVGTPAAAAIGANAAISIGIMLAPLGRSSEGDRLHAAAAGLGYLALAATAPVAAPALARRSRPMAAAAVGVGAISLVCLGASLSGPRAGLWQRVGITTTDVWLMAVGLLVLSGSRLVRPEALSAQ